MPIPPHPQGALQQNSFISAENRAMGKAGETVNRWRGKKMVVWSLAACLGTFTHRLCTQGSVLLENGFRSAFPCHCGASMYLPGLPS